MRGLTGEPVLGVAGAKGFDSAANRSLLESAGIFNGLCPRNPETLSAR